ncbi:unnamed protein product [Thelazia callipaeda]|uniref:Protein SZT2 n=1 Tax=Thelazia callipaeda TaxID=103827 RepID=A0A0N5CLL8_THECL|nr:unnamed protein product [Thelazia callipaeda]
MENSAEHCDQREIKIHIDDASSNGDGYTVREASEVMLLAADSSKIGKYAQMLWYLNHINSTIALETSRKNNGELSVINITARDGGCVNEEEPVLVTTETLISYVVESYRFIFVIDISPSTFVVDGTAGCVPHSKIMCRLRQCLQGLVMDGNFLQKIKLSPKLFISICFYSPFIAFDEDRVILQGCLLTKKNINSVLNYVQERLSVFSSRLCYIVQRHLKRWNQNRMKVRKESSDSIPENFLCDSQTANDTRKYDFAPLKMNFEADFADEGFMNSEWSLIFMLRIGFIGLQLLPDTAQPNIVVITDAVCHITDIHVLQKLMVQLWDYSVACSFVQIQDDCNTDAVFGHFSSPGFLVFLAKATSGVYIPDKVDAAILVSLNIKIFVKSLLYFLCIRILSMQGNSLLYFQDVIDSRLFLCKHLQLPDTSDNHVKNLIRQINPEFLEPYTTGVVRRMHCSMEYESSLADLLRLRFYDGFVLRNLKIFKKEKDHSSLLLELCLPWKPQVTVGYKISAPFDSYMKRTRIKITVICEAQYGVMRDLLSDRSFVSSTKQAYSDAYRHTILGLLETDRMFIHLHSFTSMPDLYHVPLELPKGKSLFRYVMKEDKAVLTISTGELENLCLCNSAAAKFVEYWRIICEFENRLWQKWSQLYTFRIILTHDHPLPQGLFLRENSNAKVTSQIALSAFYNMLSKMATFTLVHGQAYVNFIERLNLQSLLQVNLSFSDDQNSLKSFYIIKTTVETQLVVIKLLFLDGLPLSVKKKVIEELQNNIMSLSVERSLFYTRTLEFAGVDDVCTTVSETTPLPALTIINRPLEIVLARYKQIPLVLNRIICLKIDEQSRDLVLHNSLAKYFSCRRFIWYLRKAFPLSSPVSCISADFILHTILQRRLNEGFHIAYFNDGIINLIKHVGDTGEQLHSSQAILQYVIFPLSVIRPLRVTKEELDRIPSLSKIFEMRSMQTNKAVLDDSFTLKNDVGLQLMTEMWSEPLAVSNPPSNALALEEQVFNVLIF